MGNAFLICLDQVIFYLYKCGRLIASLIFKQTCIPEVK